MLAEPSQEPIISVIIPTKDRAEYLFLTLLSLCSQTLSPEKYEVIVVGNGENTEQTEIKSYIWDLEWPFRLSNFSLEYANISRTRNQGILSSKGKYLVFIDDDCLVPDNFLEFHLEYHNDGDNNYYVVGSTKRIDCAPLISYIKTELINNRKIKKIWLFVK